MSTELKHVESNTKIYYTTDYGMFKFLKGNRDINEAKVEKIKQAINNGVDILKYAPVIVNESMEIIDGQHRYAVSRELRVNVYYVIHDQSDLSIVPSINSNSTRWRTVDFLNSYIDLNKAEYIGLKDFMDKHPRISLPVAIKILHDGRTTGASDATEKFKEGLFVISHLEKATTLTKLLSDFEPYTENPYSSRFYEAISQLHNNGKYNHEHLMTKIVESGRRIDNIGTQKSIVENMESIANHKSKHRIIIV